MTKVIVSVFNNLLTDQRVEKICKTLYDNGYQVELIGSSWDGLPELKRPYPFTRISLKSKSLKFAYVEYNLKLYKLLRSKAKENCILVANDLETIYPNLLISKKKKLPLIYDSHEIFTEMPSLQGKWTKRIWQLLEEYCIPNLKYMMTANASYADWYAKKYHIKMPLVIRNLPMKMSLNPEVHNSENNPKIILYQGTINPSRGLDKVIPAMKWIDNAVLWIVGGGPKYTEYVELTKKLNLLDKVKFLGKKHPTELRAITPKANVGLSIEENGGLSYYYSLPNKISDYIQVGVPVVCSDFPEMKKIISQYKVGETIKNHSEQELAEKISLVLKRGKSVYQNELNRAAQDLCWENETPKLLQLYEKVVQENF